MADPNKIKIGKALLAEFEECIATKRSCFEPTPEQAHLIKEVYNRADCNRNRFMLTWRKQYGFGSENTIRRWIESQGIEVTKHISKGGRV